MTPRERAVAALSGNPPDRIPCVPLVDKAGGRFILSSGCCLGRDTPPENVDAMVRACEDFGGY